MFSTLPPHTHLHSFHYEYSPHVPSPLSSSPLRRSPSSSPLKDCAPNAVSNYAFGMEDEDREMESPTKSSFSSPQTQRESITKASPSTSKSTFSKRPTKPNPLMSKGNLDETRETRRKLFLKKVREGSEERRFKQRGIHPSEDEEEMLRVLWLREERAREEQRRGEVLGLGLEDSDLGLPRTERDADELEHHLGLEAAELEALLLSQHGDGMDLDGGGETEALYGSDEEDYDELFMDFAKEEEERRSSQVLLDQCQNQNQQLMVQQDGDVEMDMS